MYIKSIILDGFKSYGKKVEVTDFDPEFNAITGLNGTGKTNILDSIFFVLGITNLSKLRAGNLEELIYKNGKAGITHATVSITFDNRDKRRCPIGYANHDEITVTRQVGMGGRNKYLLNGINVQKKKISDLFCTVQLNINNPHFLIMQGEVSKVLNMKPEEILSMVGEAAGTSLYETTRLAAQKTIEQKDAKLRKLKDIIGDHVAPKLQKIRDEKAQFIEYQKVVREIERQERLIMALKYVTIQEKAKEATGKVSEVKDNIKSKQEKIKSNDEELKVLDEQVLELGKKVDKGDFILEVLENTEATFALQESNALRHLQEHLKTFKNLEEAGGSTKAVSTGLEGTSESLQDLPMAVPQGASGSLTHISKKLAKGKPMAQERVVEASTVQGQRDQNSIANHQGQVEQLQGQFSQMSLSDERRAHLLERLRGLRVGVRARRGASHTLATALQRCHFRYQPPQEDFDALKVAGTVCKLIEVRDLIYCTAIEAAAGEKLYSVVVDTEATSKLLLQHGQLQTRTTFIWLDKISGNVVNGKIVRLAQEIGGGEENVQLALDLVSFESRVRPAMVWIFGGTLVCRDLATARRVAFHPRIRKRTVTLDGDVFDPAGTLSGGATPKGGSVLMQLSEMKRLETELREAERELAMCTAELGSMQPVAEKHGALQQRQERAMRQEKEVMQQQVGARGKGKRRKIATRAQEPQPLHMEPATGARKRAGDKTKALKEVTFVDLQAQIKKKEAETASLSDDIAKLSQKKDQLLKDNNDLMLNIKELEHKSKQFHTEAARWKKKMKCLEKDNLWIPGERRFFGAAGSVYDFGADQARTDVPSLKQLRERKDQLTGGLTTHTHLVLDKTEGQYEEMVRMKRTVEAERSKLVEVMAELDIKRDCALLTACEQVSKAFGSIVSSLMAGAQACLAPLPGLTALDGVEMKVGFNSQWKESLTELTGGERSLVALSLVLALCLFKPAPLYILDEVDVALDPSHTQNIGQMLKQHFKHSQFIIVSLKDDMFNNANVVFRTHLADGMSAVERTVNDA